MKQFTATANDDGVRLSRFVQRLSLIHISAPTSPY